ncbi:MAG: NAD(P)-binding protein [Sandaracinus sp.]|nr:NAD(P)-binding protein [Sandaracinus sp.]
MPIEKHVAILGGGAAGLSAAYFLHGRTSVDGSHVYRCTVYDVSARLGGNCQSAYLGDSAFLPPFADLGVNDFNTERYLLFMEVLRQLAADGYPVPHAPLIDTTTWTTPRGVTRGARTYTDEQMAHWELHPDKPWLKNIAQDWDAFQAVAYQVLHDDKYATMSVDEFIAEQGYSEDFAEYNLRARINGMYYVNDRLPGSMPIRAVMSYYHLQEGIGSARTTDAKRAQKAADAPSPRHYFVNGASDWIRQLTACLQARGVEFRLGASPTAYLDATRGWRVLSSATPAGGRDSFDQVISAVYADTVSRVIALGLPPLMPTLLAQFQYFDSIGIVHDDVSMLPPEEKDWSTYNILVYPPGTRLLRPYTITYVERKHHGEDTNEPPYVTLTPYGAVDESGIPTMIDLPSAERVSAVSYLRHNTLSVDAMAAQKYVRALQGQNGLWFTGGWTNGAGLHEEILAMSKEIAMRIRGYFVLGQHEEGYHDADPSYVPKHLRDTFAEEPDLFPDGFWE